MPGTHALLSPSSAYRWMECPPSARLTEGMDNETSVFAEEGTCAHSLCEYKVNKAIGIETEDPRPTLAYLDEEMEECSDEYASFVMETLAKTEADTGSKPIISTEERLDISKYVPECSGTGDCIICSEGIIHIIDMKYGAGTRVDAERNPQLMIYALGAYEMYNFFFDIKTVRMSIFQPRMANVCTYEMSLEDLLTWAQEELMPKAELAFNGDGNMASGPWCKFCKLKANCKQRAMDNLASVREDFALPPVLSNDEVSEILNKAGEIKNWLVDIEAYAFDVLQKGGEIPGFKLVEGKSNRKYSSEDEVAKAVEQAGYNPYEKKVLGITAMTSLLGKKKFNELLSAFIVKPQGKATLAPLSDERKAINTTLNDFNA